MPLRLIPALLALLAAPALAQTDGMGDPERGERQFRACRACHQVGENARHGVGPALNAIMGRSAGTQPGYRFSAVMALAGAEGLDWTPETLDAYLANPRAYLPGAAMAYAGMRHAGDRADVIAYIARFSPREPEPEADPAPAKHRRPSDPELPPGLRDAVGDAEYGEYLAQECATCHQRSGAATGIPAIRGWPEAEFAAALNAYRVGARENQAMRMVAGRLDDEAIAALAAWFATQDE